MACGSCGKRIANAVEYVYIYKNARGETTTYTNQFEARSRVLREGGTWTKEPVTA